MTTEAKPKPAELSGHKEAAVGFDADARAAEREGASITIGGRTFTRRRKNWDATRALRAILREQDRSGSKVERLSTELDDLDGTTIAVLQRRLDQLDADDRESDRAKRWRAKVEQLELKREGLDRDDLDAQVAELQERLDVATEESDDVAYRMIALLLRDEESQQPDVDFLKEELDVEDVGALASKLAGGGEPDPTPPVPETATS